MKIALFAYSRQGCSTARRIFRCYPAAEITAYAPERLSGDGFQPIPGDKQCYADSFRQADALIFVGSCGIAVRHIAPYVCSKTTDPAVLCVDELGTFVISLLSGHIGGANALARQLADTLGATPVITTATDINHRFSVDAWAARQGLVIGSMALAKEISARILEGDLPLHSDFPVVSPYPGGIVPGDSGELGISISCRTADPFAKTLHLIPRVLHLGIGCRKGTDCAAIEAAVHTALQAHGLDIRAVGSIASIDLKAQEAGLLSYCEKYGIVPKFYTAEQLLAVPGTFTSSPFVQSITGVDNVCERAALLGAEQLIVKKTAMGGVTVAIAAEKWEVHFG